jgi:protein O-mannosyl-transferase
MMPDRRQRHGWLRAAAVVLVVAGIYWNSLSAPFLFDDIGAVVNNPTIRSLSLGSLIPPADGSTTTGRPLVNLSLAFNHAVSGDAVWSYHVLNTLIHAMAALALMGVVRRAFCGPVLGEAWGKASVTISFLSAVLWAVHPLQTESVVCVAQRTESLCGLFYLLTLYAFARSRDPGAHGPLWLAVSFLSCLAGMATKEVMATAPLVVMLYDRTFFAAGFAAAWRRSRGYYAAIASTWLLLGWLLLRSGGARGVAAGFGLGISSWSYLLKQCEAIVLYLRLSFWPHPLVLDYGTGVVHSLADVWWQGLVVLGLLATTVWALVRKPAPGFAGAWFFVILAPSSSVVPLVTQTMAEHRMYLPLAAIVVLAVAALWRLGGARILWLPVAASVGLGAATVARNHDYRNVVAIWNDNVATYPQSARGHNNLAWALADAGRNDEADEHFARAVELQPGYVTAHYNWGAFLLTRGRVDEAIRQLEAAVQLAPFHADACVNLGNALVRAGRPAEAVARYEQALAISPDADVHYNLGVALLELGRTREAAAHLETSLETSPGQPEAHFRLGMLAEQAGRRAEAQDRYLETLRLAPDHAGAHRKLGLLFARDNRLTSAAEHFRALIRLQPADADARANLGNVLLLQGQVREAIVLYEEALRLRPGDARLREALETARAALR